MKFFTPELYLRSNSPDDDEADLAAEEWERAIKKYEKHINSLYGLMAEEVRSLAFDRCFHDARLLNVDNRRPHSPIVADLYIGKTRVALAGTPCSTTTILLKHDNSFTLILYYLWKSINVLPPGESWPFPAVEPDWLYDEVDVVWEDDPGIVDDESGEEVVVDPLLDEEASPHQRRWYWHRILFSNGHVFEIPFFDVVIRRLYTGG